MPTWKKVITSGSSAVLSSVTASNGFFGTASWALSSSQALTASFVNTLNQNVIITGSAAIGTGSSPNENTLTLGARDQINEGGQLGLNAPHINSGQGQYSSASFLDNYQNRFRVLRGANSQSNAEVFSVHLHTGQLYFPKYTGSGAFTGTAAGYIAVDTSGNVLTTAGVAGTVTIQDEGASQGSAGTINFSGSGVTATVAGGVATVIIPGGGGSGTPGGSNTYVQFNSASAFAGSSRFVYDYTVSSLALGDTNVLSTSQYSFAVGQFNNVSGKGSLAVGDTNAIAGNYGIASGDSNYVYGDWSVASGRSNYIRVLGDYSHVEGYGNNVYSQYSHAEGNSNFVGTQAYHGNCNGSGDIYLDSAYGDIRTIFTSLPESYIVVSDSAIAATFGTLIAVFNNASFDGTNTIVTINTESIAAGTAGDVYIAPYSALAAAGTDFIIGNYAHAEGSSDKTLGYYSHAEGCSSRAINDYSHAEGFATTTIGKASHAEGYTTFTDQIANFSHAEGIFTYTGEEGAHAEGYSTSGSGKYSHAEGMYTTAFGQGSHAEGYYTNAGADYSYAGGRYTITSASYQMVVGQFNAHGNTNDIFVIGGGLNDSQRWDVFNVSTTNITMSGSVNVTGTLSVNGNQLIKAGSGSAASFIGTPRSASISFGTAFSNNNYSVTVTGEDARTWSIQSKTSTGFTINSNSSVALTGPVYWIATPFANS